MKDAVILQKHEALKARCHSSMLPTISFFDRRLCPTRLTASKMHLDELIRLRVDLMERDLLKKNLLHSG
jgi:hypothetical protein